MRVNKRFKSLIDCPRFWRECAKREGVIFHKHATTRLPAKTVFLSAYLRKCRGCYALSPVDEPFEHFPVLPLEPTAVKICPTCRQYGPRYKSISLRLSNELSNSSEPEDLGPKTIEELCETFPGHNEDLCAAWKASHHLNKRFPHSSLPMLRERILEPPQKGMDVVLLIKQFVLYHVNLERLEKKLQQLFSTEKLFNWAISVASNPVQSLEEAHPLNDASIYDLIGRNRLLLRVFLDHLQSLDAISSLLKSHKEARKAASQKEKKQQRSRRNNPTSESREDALVPEVKTGKFCFPYREHADSLIRLDPVHV
jgi:hypothetical protein